MIAIFQDIVYILYNFQNEERLESITISSKISELTIKSWIEDIKKEAKGTVFIHIIVEQDEILLTIH